MFRSLFRTQVPPARVPDPVVLTAIIEEAHDSMHVSLTNIGGNTLEEMDLPVDTTLLALAGKIRSLVFSVAHEEGGAKMGVGPFCK